MCVLGLVTKKRVLLVFLLIVPLNRTFTIAHPHVVLIFPGANESKAAVGGKQSSLAVLSREPLPQTSDNLALIDSCRSLLCLSLLGLVTKLSVNVLQNRWTELLCAPRGR